MKPTPFETRNTTAFISAYNVTRQYGGPEEGGWWYDSYEWLKVSIPFRASQDYEWRELPEDEMDPMYVEANSAQYGWKTCGPPRPRDTQAEIQLGSFRFHLKAMFGEETKTRGSVLSEGDIEFIIERNPGERGEWPRPRYE